MKTKQFEREYTTFKSLISSVYLDNTVSHLLDKGDNTLKYSILNILETLIYNFGAIDISGKYAEQKILENPVVQAMLSQKLLYMKYYYS